MPWYFLSFQATKRKSISFDQPSTPKSDAGPKKKFAKTPARPGNQGGKPAGVYAPPTGKYSSGMSFEGKSPWIKQLSNMRMTAPIDRHKVQPWKVMTMEKVGISDIVTIITFPAKVGQP